MKEYGTFVLEDIFPQCNPKEHINGMNKYGTNMRNVTTYVTRVT